MRRRQSSNYNYNVALARQTIVSLPSQSWLMILELAEAYHSTNVVLYICRIFHLYRQEIARQSM